MSDLLPTCRCGAALPAMKRPGNPRKWCSPACQKRHDRLDHPNRPRSKPSRLTPNGQCGNCSKPIFIGKSSRPNPICHECRALRHWIRSAWLTVKVEVDSEPLPPVSDCLAAVRVIWSLGGPAIAWTALGACDFCSGPFESVTHSDRPRTKCASCRQRLGAWAKQRSAA